MRATIFSVAALVTFSGVPLVTLAQDPYNDPPTRVGRISDISGNVSIYPADAQEWTDASLNYPLTSGDAVWADDASRAELHLGGSALRLGARTSMTLGEISETTTQVRVDQGSLDVRLRGLDEDEVYEVDTPGATISLLTEGHYRIDVTADGRRTTVSVRQGDAEAIEGARHYHLFAGTSQTLLGPLSPPIMGAVVPVDEWESWANDCEARDNAGTSTRYVSPEVIGYEDLDRYGEWEQEASYGAVWIPRGTPAGWAPYRNGHWASVQPWGWTWIAAEPWGFAPFHYGRWANVRGRWGWVPGPIHTRPIYAPALVAFIGGAGWSATLALGNGGGVGWVPLAPGEPFIPSYRATPRYISRVNVNVSNGRGGSRGPMTIDRVTFANRNVPNAVTVVNRGVFEGGRPVAGATVAFQPSMLTRARPSSAPNVNAQPIVAPTRPRFPANGEGRGNVSRPPALRGGQSIPTPPPPVRARPRGQTGEPVPPSRGNVGRGQAPPPAIIQSPPVVPPPAPPTRGRGQVIRPPTPPVIPPPPTSPVPPKTIPPRARPIPPDSGRGRGQSRPIPQSPPVRPPTPPTPPVIPPAPPARGQTPPVMPPAPPARGQTPPPTRGRPPQAPPSQTGQGQAPPTPPPAPPPARGRGQAAPPPVRPRQVPPDTGRGGGGRPASDTLPPSTARVGG